MKKVFSFLLFSIMFLTANYALAQPLNSASNSTAITEAKQRLDHALIEKNMEALNNLLSEDLQMMHSNGMQETKQTLLDNLKDGVLQYYTIEELSGNCKATIVGGKEAKSIRDLHVTGILNNEKFDVNLTVNEEWKLLDGNWQLIKRESKNRE